MISVDQACDYIITHVYPEDTQPAPGNYLSLLKLQKLLYYAQAWHLAFHRTRLFNDDFEAWVHGPVNRHIYDRFKESKMLYSTVSLADRQPGFDPESLPADDRDHINAVLGEYAQYTDTQLESLTHEEDPWKKAREGLAPSAPCARPIEDEAMRDYYAKRLAGNTT